MGNVFEILTEVRLEHSSKADEEIKVTLSGILMEVSLQQPENASIEIESTLFAITSSPDKYTFFAHMPVSYCRTLFSS